MNGLPAILLTASTAMTAISTLFEGKKKNALIFTGIGTAIAACAVAARNESKKKAGTCAGEDKPADISIEVDISSEPHNEVMLEPEFVPAE